MTDLPTIATQVLEEWGAIVKPLPTSSKEESDLVAVLDGVKLLIEEKSKFENPDEMNARNTTLKCGHVHGSTQQLGQNNRLSGIVRKATKQLSSTGADTDHDLKILWFTGVGFNAEVNHLQFISTLYGTTRIFELNKRQMRECYFFRNGDFYRYRDHLDGAVAAYLIGDTVTVKLCLNPYSASWEALRDSPFAKNFKHGLIDPVAEEARGEAYIADTDLPRRNEQEILRFLEEKYGLEMAQYMDMKMASVVVSIPK
jgi:hypothetical protein